MNMLWQYTFYSLLFVNIPITIVYMFLISKLITVLKTSHASVYRQLGAPTLFTNNSPANSFRLMSFVLRRTYRDLGDARLASIASVCRLLLIVGLTIGAICFLIVTFHWV